MKENGGFQIKWPADKTWQYENALMLNKRRTKMSAFAWCFFIIMPDHGGRPSETDSPHPTTV